MPVDQAASGLEAVLRQTHQQAALVLLATKENAQHLDVPLPKACTKPIHGTIEGEMAKASQEILA